MDIRVVFGAVVSGPTQQTQYACEHVTCASWQAYWELACFKEYWVK